MSTFSVPAPAALDEDALRTWLRALREGGAARWQPLADLAGLPLAEVVASPFGLRAIALGVRVGARSVHRELRTPVDFGDDPRTADPMHGVWDRGQLHIGKYQAFLQDAPHVTYDPAHHAKWAPHEMLHRAASFLWVEDEFERYVGARLNELLPVAVWWGHDQFCRLDDDGYDRAGGVVAPSVDDARWLHEDEGALAARVARTRPHLLRGIGHVETEQDAVAEELRTRQLAVRRHRVPHATLDASSDALAYVVAHRSRREAVAEVVAPYAFDDVAAYQAHIAELHRTLLHAPLTIDAVACAAAAKARDEWDVGLRRVLLGARHTPEDADELAQANGHLGYDLDLLGAGVESFAPKLVEVLDAEASRWIESLAESPALWRRACLPERVTTWLAGEPGPAWWRALLAFEIAVAEARPDPRADELQDEGLHVIRNRAFLRHAAEFDVAAVHAGETAEPAPGPVAWWIGASRGEVHVVPESPEVAAALACVDEGPAPAEEVARAAGADFDALLRHRVLLRTHADAGV